MTVTPLDTAPPPATEREAPSRSRGEWTAYAVLLAGTAALYLWNLSINGWGNEFYAGAVQAMTWSWEAFFFAASDAGGTITVDKPPASLWVMALSARIFGLSSWSILVPQALMGVGTVALLYAAVRRVSGPRPALLAGAALALTPVAVLMFRFDNPDALLVLLMVAAAYAVVRALETANTRWLLLAGVLMGLAFLTKTAQAFLVLPALALAYLWAAPTGLGRRVRQLLAAGLALVVSGGWWFAIVELWPADSRPYIGGSTTNSALELALGYNGLSRILGGFGGGGLSGGGMRGGGMPGGGMRGGMPGGGMPGGGMPGGGMPGGGMPGGAPGGAGLPGGGSPFGGGAGIGRLFAFDVGGQVAWLLPAALVLMVVGFWLTRSAPRTDRVRASLLLWGGWTLVTALVFSFMSGIFHQYYTVALAPGIAAVVGIGGAELWRRRSTLAARIALAVVVAGTAVWACVLLARTPDFAPWAGYVVGALGLVAVVALLWGARSVRIATAGIVAAALAVSVGPAAYAQATVASAKSGAIALAGPATVGGFGGPGRGAGAGFESDSTDAELIALLQGAGTKWSAATVAATSAAGLALDSRTDVMGIGGFMGSDPAPTLAEFQAAVAAGEIRYFVVGGGRGGGPGAVDARQMPSQVPESERNDPQFEQYAEMLDSGQGPGGGGGGFGRGGSSSEISIWVEENFTEATVGARTVYDLTQPTG